MLIPLLLGGAVVAWLYSTRRPATAGAAARVGDEVFVPFSSLPANTAPLNPGFGYVVLRVTNATPTDVTGTVVAGVTQLTPNIVRFELPQPVAVPAAVPRSNITHVFRNRQQVA